MQPPDSSQGLVQLMASVKEICEGGARSVVWGWLEGHEISPYLRGIVRVQPRSGTKNVICGGLGSVKYAHLTPSLPSCRAVPGLACAGVVLVVVEEHAEGCWAWCCSDTGATFAGLGWRAKPH